MTTQVPISRWLDRIGAALVAPRLALSSADSEGEHGRASSDIAALLALAFLAIQTQLFATCAWFLVDGNFKGAALQTLVFGAKEHLVMPVIVLLGASIIISVAAGKKRSPSRDFDLACVALVPVVVVELVNQLLFELGIDSYRVCFVVGYAWGAYVLALAVGQARGRQSAANTDGQGGSSQP